MYIQIQELYKTARQVDDIAAIEFISGLVTEQIETIALFKKLVFRIKNSNIIPVNIEFLDEVINKDVGAIG